MQVSTEEVRHCVQMDAEKQARLDRAELDRVKLELKLAQLSLERAERDALIFSQRGELTELVEERDHHQGRFEQMCVREDDRLCKV
jgi:hypothetical protein